jgi:DNA primase
MFNVVDLHLDSDIIAICEGELDTVVLAGEVGVPAVGVPGVGAWKPWFPKLFEPYRRVFVFADNDNKKGDGSNPGMELAKKIKDSVERATIVHMPENLDVTDVFLARGADWFLGKVEEGK